MGVESYHRGELELASHFLKKALNRGDMSRLSHTVPLYLSEIAAAQGDDAEAFEILEAYLEETENGAGTGSGSGGGESGTGTGSGRSETGGPGSETGPETGGAGLIRFQLGDLYLRRGEYQEALRSFRQYLKSGPPPRMEHRASYAAAFAEYRLGNMEQALSLTDRALGLEGPNRADALRLKSRILNRMGSVDQAAAVLDELVGEENARPGVEQMKLYFQAGEHRAVVSLAEELREDAGSLSPEDALQVEYLAGLSHVSLKNYEQALKALEKVSPGRARELGLDEIIPSAAYYRAWSMYRLRMFERALGEAEAFIETFPGHQLTDDALFLAGWCSFSLQRYREAARLFGRLAEGFPGAPADKALFLQAQSLLNLDQNQQAADLFSRLYTQQPGSAYADDAMLAHANLLRDTGSGGRAAQVYLQLWEEHPDSPLADEALYYRGETLFTASDFSAAAGAFDLYLRSFPGGGLEDASLYWGGEAELRAGNRVRALELWGRLIKRPDSSFRPDALYQSAESYIKLGDYQKAAELYGRLADQYPEYAAGVGASVRQREISYMAQGLDQREAELTAAVSAGSGAQTAEGRRAMLELARLYLMERGDNEKAFQLLSRVAKASDPAAKQEAGILLGEYYYRTGDIERAGRTFFNAALENPANRDMTAYGLFKAAQMMKLAGNEKDLRQLVDRLKRNFPGSSWSKDAEKLLESVEGFDARGGSS
jgi:TolA-binding protein